MLDLWIIEKLREKEKQKEEPLRIQLPVPYDEDYYSIPKKKDEPKEERGVFHININGDEE